MARTGEAAWMAPNAPKAPDADAEACIEALLSQPSVCLAVICCI
eukprot:CAMPEP_0173195652 /NCGR_PEP_ID=MMETSP1141-20130122/15179_1 /TAXON_ID=483371 /ORGANISM="non described non described, Strain CCMP2298" /LENGTH=43 /DNA_ID= /DNA_START= /DNA_END= /DNA_ORIENTATION=